MAASFARRRRHEHDVEAEGLVGERLYLLYLTLEKLRRHVRRRDNSEAAAVADRRREVRVGDPGHAALDYRVFDFKQFGYRVIFKHLSIRSLCFV